MAVTHKESAQERISAIGTLIADLCREIAELEDERAALIKGETSLRSLGLERRQLYPLWRLNVRTVEAFLQHMSQHPHIPGVGAKGLTAILEAIDGYRKDK
ncbi:MAG: hypothetical protein LC130_26080 [Bryobacterales bacterium]|nr:hypothetical protein [Bryobacterales bacterium]